MAQEVSEPGNDHPGQQEQHDEEAKQNRISDILHSGGFRTKYTMENMRRLRGIDLGAISEDPDQQPGPGEPDA